MLAFVAAFLAATLNRASHLRPASVVIHGNLFEALFGFPLWATQSSKIYFSHTPEQLRSSSFCVEAQHWTLVPPLIPQINVVSGLASYTPAEELPPSFGFPNSVIEWFVSALLDTTPANQDSGDSTVQPSL